MGNLYDLIFDFNCACGDANCSKDIYGEPVVIVQAILKDLSFAYFQGVYRIEGYVSVKLENDGDEREYFFITKDMMYRNPQWFREMALNKKKCYLAETAFTFVSRIQLSSISNEFIFQDPQHVISVITSHAHHNQDHRDKIEYLTLDVIKDCIRLKDYYIGLQHE